MCISRNKIRMNSIVIAADSTDRNVLSHIIRSRRTIKPHNYSDKTVRKEFIEEIIENANWAPSHGRTYPWRFFIHSLEARESLADTLGTIYREITSKEGFRENKLAGLRQNILNAPVTISIALERDKTGKITEIDELMAVACAVQNMHLTATAFGLGGFWSTNIAAISDRYRDHLGLSDGDKALGLFFIGYPKIWPDANRGSTDDICKWYGW